MWIGQEDVIESAQKSVVGGSALHVRTDLIYRVNIFIYIKKILFIIYIFIGYIWRLYTLHCLLHVCRYAAYGQCMHACIVARTARKEDKIPLTAPSALPHPVMSDSACDRNATVVR